MLVVAFDGMDKELVEEFDLDNIIDEEFGLIGKHQRYDRKKDW